ncbi:flagellar hook protein FlgE [Paracoccus sp. M683]|uniref:flagellar hook protein FlgE n=1 Tax=Paracoccus sp. M683 TaxID=2594268 RepID=UPI001180FB13|nr:flagellar hook protein FlgE [Paracoccus sp. M683]TRW95964.1 flagellar hook protein FlgE [Paracoccus sp. M683]
MSMSSALNASVSGLAANSTKLATISDNIANSGTYGYKRVETSFDSIVLNQSRNSGVYSAGGVQAASRRIIDQDGALITTSNAMDIAISGRGMLPVTTAVDLDNGFSDQPMIMTRTGSFRTDSSGILRTDSGLVLLGWPARSDGSIPVMTRDTTVGLVPIQIETNQNSGDPTTEISLGVNLPAQDTVAGEPGDPLSLQVEYFDNLGASESLNVTFTPDVSGANGRSNTWTLEIRDSATDPALNPLGQYQITFDDTHASGGNIVSVTTLAGDPFDPATGDIMLNLAGGPLALEIGVPGGISKLKQLSSSFSPTNITKNGSPVGNLTSVEIDENGFVRATYDTGFIKTLYQVPLVDVPNPNGLMSLDSQTYMVSPTSGSFFLWDAGDGPTGSVVGYALESSTTDVAAELTDLIQTQRAYSSNAKVVQTVDEMLQETTSIKR